jgi:undecaprenyl-diphosphatase
VERAELQQDRTLVLGFVGAVAALLIFAWLARDVLRGQTIAFDAAVRNAVHGWASPQATYAMRGLSWIGSEIVLVPLGALAAFRLRAIGRKHAAILFIVAAMGGEALDQLLKLVFHRTRPEPFFGYRLPDSYSFPSGHAMVSFCFYVVLAGLLTLRMPWGPKKLAIWTLGAGLALFIGISRIYLGVHYPSDVLAGFMAALIWVGSVRMGYAFWLKRRRGSGE